MNGALSTLSLPVLGSVVGLLIENTSLVDLTLPVLSDSLGDIHVTIVGALSLPALVVNEGTFNVKADSVSAPNLTRAAHIQLTLSLTNLSSLSTVSFPALTGGPASTINTSSDPLLPKCAVDALRTQTGIPSMEFSSHCLDSGDDTAATC